jgi:hypothetical protein
LRLSHLKMHWLAAVSVALTFYLSSCQYLAPQVPPAQNPPVPTFAPTEAPASYPAPQTTLAPALNPPAPTFAPLPAETTKAPAQGYGGLRSKRQYGAPPPAQDAPKPTFAPTLAPTEAPAAGYPAAQTTLAPALNPPVPTFAPILAETTKAPAQGYDGQRSKRQYGAPIPPAQDAPKPTFAPTFVVSLV